MVANLLHHTHKPTTMTIPRTIENEILPFVHEQPTSKEEIITAMKEYCYSKRNFKTVMNFLFSLPFTSFYRGGDGRVYIDRFSI
jgi:hypothetical protein